MGLGKTLQTIAIIYTMLTQGPTGGANPGAPTPPKQDRNGFVHLLWNSEELRLADTCLHRAAQATGRVTLAFTKTTDKSGRGFGPPPA